MRVFTIFLIFLSFSFLSGAQPWMRYYQPDDSATAYERFLSMKKAFHAYMEQKGEYPDTEGEGEEDEAYELFERWMWLVEPRFSEAGTIASRTLWEEILRKREDERPGSALGDWHPLGPEDPPTDLNSGQVIGTGRIDCIAFHPTDTNIIYIGTPTGGIWKTTDGGHTWTPLGDMLASIGISDIALYPGHPDTIFVATGDRDAGEVYSVGILRSNDGGVTWKNTGLSFDQEEGYRVNRLVIRPDQPDTMIAGTSKGLYLITNQAMTVHKILDGHFKDIELMPGNSRVIYAATYGSDGSTIYRSTDGGNTFVEKNNGIDTDKILRIDLALSPADPGRIYAVTVDKETSGLYKVYRSYDLGDHWIMLLSGTTTNILGNSPTGNSDDGQGWYDLSMVVSPTNANEIYVGGINIWKSSSGGGSWHLKTWGYPEYSDQGVAYIHVDQHILKVQPGSGALFAGNDGGIYKSNDGGETFTNLSYGLQILQIYRIGTTDQKRAMAMMGSQDNSTILWRDTSWNVVIGGDGMECIIDPSDTNVLYASSQYGNIKRSMDGGKSFYRIKPKDAEKGGWITPYLLSPHNPSILYAGYTEIFRSYSRGDTWSKLTTSLSQGHRYRLLKISKKNPDFVYAGTSNNLWRSENGGISWRSILAGLPRGLVVTDLEISQYDPRKIWITLSGFSAGEKVYASEDGGASWINYSAGLPNVPANCIVYEENSNSRLYVGTDLGVYVRDHSMERWKDFSRNLPNVIINEMQIYGPDSLLRAGTYGRGLWESKLYVPDSLPLYAEFTSDKIVSCRGSYFSFYNKYPREKDSLIWYFLPDGEPQVIRNTDTARVLFPTTGAKDVAMVIYHNGISDSVYRQKYVTVDTVIHVQIEKNYNHYYWRGKELVLEGKDADDYRWVVTPGNDTLYGQTIRVYPDTTVTYRLLASQGECHDTAALKVVVWPNDLIRYAVELTYGENGPFINNEATTEKGEPMPPAGNCNTDSTWCDEFDTGKDYLAHSVWFWFDAPETGVVSVDSKGFDTQLALYDALSADSLLAGHYHLLAANDDYHTSDDYAAALQEVSGLTPGKRYWLQLDGSGGNQEGTFYLYLYSSPLDVPENKVSGTGKNTFTVYPNPNNGTFSLVLPENMTPGSLLKVFTSDGRLVYQEKLPYAPEKQSVPSSVSPLKKGLYILVINAGKKIYSCRMIVR